MSKRFSPPALQHLARSIRETPEEVAKALLAAFQARPPFSYRFLDQLVRIALRGSCSLQQFNDAVKLHQKVVKYQSIFLEITPLIHAHFSAINPRYILDVPPQLYRVGRLEIPFRPAFAFELGGEIVIPWFIFWKENPLSPLQLSLLATLIKELLEQEPDYADARVLIYDFSAECRESERTLKIIDATTIPRLSNAQRNEILEVFVEGFNLAEIESMHLPPRRPNAPRTGDDPQIPLLSPQDDE